MRWQFLQVPIQTDRPVIRTASSKNGISGAVKPEFLGSDSSHPTTKKTRQRIELNRVAGIFFIRSLMAAR
jgi:hypothetical protein